MKRVIGAVALCACAAASASQHAIAAPETWSEIKSAHFTVWSNAGDRAARSITWQLEQIRSVTVALWPWAKVDVAKPITVFAVKDEQSLRLLAPSFWERKGGLHPVSVWATGADQHYLLIRTDVSGEDNSVTNPHQTAYFSYGSLVINSSFGRDLPFWFSRGLAGILSNTLVRDDHLLIGAPIATHLRELQERRMPLRQLLTTSRSDAGLRTDDGLWRFDAQAWAFVHFLMFAEGGAYRDALNRFAAAVTRDKGAEAAFTEAIGQFGDFQNRFASYVTRNIFNAGKIAVNAEVKRERFAVRPIPLAECAGGRAAFHVAMGRPTDARSLIAEARAADAEAPAAYVAEGLLSERSNNSDEARAAYAKAVEYGTSSAWAHYRLATLGWHGGQTPDAAAFGAMEKQLMRAVELQPSFAAGYAALAEVRAALRQTPGAIMPLLTKAIALEPASPWHRLAGARVLWRLGSPAEARQTAEAALALADSEAARSEAQRLLASIPAK